METEKQAEVSQANVIRMFFDGAGCRPDGEGSGYAWVCPDSNERLVKRVAGLTNNQAEYRGFLSALEYPPEGAIVDMCSDSQLICSQFSGAYRVKDEALQILLSEVRAVISRKRLQLTLRWVPRNQNLAGKLL